MKYLTNFWHNTFLYKRFVSFVESKSEKTARKIACAELWDLTKDLNLATRIRKKFPNGTDLYCYIDCKVSEVIFKEIFEIDELAFVDKYLEEGDVFIDIGSNIGLFTILAAKKVGVNGKVLSFEPCSKTYKRLLQNIELNNFTNIIDPIQHAVSDISGETELKLADGGYDAWNSLAMPSAGVNYNIERIKTISIQDLENQFSFISKAKLIKIDVEGWEMNVLKGGQEFFANADSPDLMVEFTEENAKNAGYTCKQLYSYLENLGYRIYKYDSINNKFLSYNSSNEFVYVNLFATKNISRARKIIL
jgi:FkbM family methyltransferase